MKDLFNDERAIMSDILMCMLSLFVIVVTYFMFMPFLTLLTNVLLGMGAPSSTLLYLKYARWGFYLFAVAALLILLAKVYKKTYDTSQRIF